MRELGRDPNDSKMIYARLGRYGPMLQKGLAEDSEEKADFRRSAGRDFFGRHHPGRGFGAFPVAATNRQDEGRARTIYAKHGPYGPYLEVGDKTLRVPLKEEDPLTISLEQSAGADRCQEGRGERRRLSQTSADLRIINGPYGPYITDGKKNGKIPKKDR